MVQLFATDHPEAVTMVQMHTDWNAIAFLNDKKLLGYIIRENLRHLWQQYVIESLSEEDQS
ncbi:MAG: hypothetical protein QE487_09305 [Fluviicola sp.]|nr:hypothetical protein [Fluviicola sp.]